MVETAMRCDTQEPTITALAPAKINLFLHIHGKRPDGYHALTSLVTGVDLSDELVFTPTDRPGIDLSCDDPNLPTHEGNLVIRAATRLAELLGRPPGVRIELRKRIPVAAGLGGGSSDAATTLRALNHLWRLGLDAGELISLGAGLGSDVPLFFFMPAAVVRGRGEQVQSATLRWSGWVVLAFGGWAVSTREVYANWQETDGGQYDYNAVDDLRSCSSATVLGPGLVNELEAAVFQTVPAVRDFHAALVNLTGHPWRISGAGSTAFALFDRQAEAGRTADAIRDQGLAQRVVVVRNLRESIERQHGEEAATWIFPKSA